MSLLFDQNLSHVLCDAVQHVFPGSIHVKSIHFEKESDSVIWEYAGENDLTIVTKDVDFHQRSFVYGHPPKVIWLRTGNCSTTDIIRLLINNADAIKTFIHDADGSFLILRFQ